MKSDIRPFTRAHVLQEEDDDNAVMNNVIDNKNNRYVRNLSNS